MPNVIDETVLMYHFDNHPVLMSSFHFHCIISLDDCISTLNPFLSLYE